jgi:hypothetical protein
VPGPVEEGAEDRAGRFGLRRAGGDVDDEEFAEAGDVGLGAVGREGDPPVAPLLVSPGRPMTAPAVPVSRSTGRTPLAPTATYIVLPSGVIAAPFGPPTLANSSGVAATLVSVLTGTM